MTSHITDSFARGCRERGIVFDPANIKEVSLKQYQESPALYRQMIVTYAATDVRRYYIYDC